MTLAITYEEFFRGLWETEILSWASVVDLIILAILVWVVK